MVHCDPRPNDDGTRLEHSILVKVGLHDRAADRGTVADADQVELRRKVIVEEYIAPNAHAIGAQHPNDVRRTLKDEGHTRKKHLELVDPLDAPDEGRVHRVLPRGVAPHEQPLGQDARDHERESGEQDGERINGPDHEHVGNTARRLAKRVQNGPQEDEEEERRPTAEGEDGDLDQVEEQSRAPEVESLLLVLPLLPILHQEGGAAQISALLGHVGGLAPCGTTLLSVPRGGARLRSGLLVEVRATKAEGSSPGSAHFLENNAAPERWSAV
eukprot:scaffold16214_cov73-Phaeocystis_antarctica.AAC.3